MTPAKTKCRYYDGKVCSIAAFKPRNCKSCMAFRPKGESLSGIYTEEVEVSEEVWNNL